MTDIQNGGFTAISEDELQVFDLDRGIKVNEAICRLHQDAETALRMMSGATTFYRPLNKEDPVVKTRTFQRLEEIVKALDELATLTKPVVQSRF